MCDTCRVLLDELSRRRLEGMLYRASLTRASLDNRSEAVKQLNHAELELRAAVDLLNEHQAEHERMNGAVDDTEPAA
jgi:hypothetical protein